MDNCYLGPCSAIVLFANLAKQWAQCEVQEYDSSRSVPASKGGTSLSYLSLNHNMIGHRAAQFLAQALRKYYYCHSLRHVRVCMTRGGIGHADLLKVFVSPKYGKRLLVLEQHESELSVANSLLDTDADSLGRGEAVVGHLDFFLTIATGDTEPMHSSRRERHRHTFAADSLLRNHAVLQCNAYLLQYVGGSSCSMDEEEEVAATRMKEKATTACISAPLSARVAFISALVVPNKRGQDSKQRSDILRLNRDVIRVVFEYMKTPVQRILRVRTNKDMDC
jgi:hypothetical protein